MEILLNILKEIWEVTNEMAPYLLFGFLMAGILSVLISKNYVRTHLGGHGWLPSIKAALIGVPMPICSCGVIPLAASLRKHGAGRGATASFLASTPQTGVDSLMITYALLGWVYALFRAAVAFISGILCGITVGAVSPKEEPTEQTEQTTNDRTPPQDKLKYILSYSFLTLPRDISKSMVLGIVISGIISGLLGDGFLEGKVGDASAMLIMLLIGIPLYVCSSGSVPIALAFIKAGISPGAALVFLITGPATNAATLTTLWSIIGKRQLVVFLLTLILCALGAGILLNLLDTQINITEQIACHPENPSPIRYLWTTLLIAVLANGMRKKR